MGLGIIRTLRDELQMRYGRATDTKVRKILGILSDPWHVTTDHSKSLHDHVGYIRGKCNWPLMLNNDSSKILK